MPLVDWNQEITYNHPHVYGSSGGYNRDNKVNLYYMCQQELLIRLFPFSPGETILLVGAGFGWLAEDFLSHGLGPVCAVDTSAWIQAEKINHSVVDVHDLDVTNAQDQDQIKVILGLDTTDKIDWCITEDFFTGCSDSECLVIANALRSIGKNVIHYITPPPLVMPGPESVLYNRNWKTGAEWKQLLAPDYILMVRSGTVL